MGISMRMIRRATFERCRWAKDCCGSEIVCLMASATFAIEAGVAKRYVARVVCIIK